MRCNVASRPKSHANTWLVAPINFKSSFAISINVSQPSERTAQISTDRPKALLHAYRVMNSMIFWNVHTQSLGTVEPSEANLDNVLRSMLAKQNHF